MTTPQDVAPPRLGLDVWVIYWNPSDYPGKYVTRRQSALEDNRIAAERRCHVSDSIDQARSHVPAGLYRMDAWPGDDPVIVETWI